MTLTERAVAVLFGLWAGCVEAAERFEPGGAAWPSPIVARNWRDAAAWWAADAERIWAKRGNRG